MDTLIWTTKFWLQPEQHSTTQVTEKVTFHPLPKVKCLAIGMKAPKTPAQLMDALERALATLEMPKLELSSKTQDF